MVDYFSFKSILNFTALNITVAVDTPFFQFLCLMDLSLVASKQTLENPHKKPEKLKTLEKLKNKP